MRKRKFKMKVIEHGPLINVKCDETWYTVTEKGRNLEDNRIPLSALAGAHPIETTDWLRCTQTQHRHQAHSLCLLNFWSNHITTWM
jgi:hypothetical protein